MISQNHAMLSPDCNEKLPTKSSFRLLKIMLGLIVLMLTAAATFAATDTYSTSGTFTWTAPAGVTSAVVEVWGSGGGGGVVREYRWSGVRN